MGDRGEGRQRGDSRTPEGSRSPPRGRADNTTLGSPQLKAQGPSRTCNESKEEEGAQAHLREGVRRLLQLPLLLLVRPRAPPATATPRCS